MKVKPGPIQKSGRPLKCLQSVLLTAEDNAAYSAASLTDCVVSGCASVPPPPSPPPSLLLPVMSVRQEAGRQAGSARSATCTAAGRGRPPPPPSPPPPPPPRRRARARSPASQSPLSLSGGVCRLCRVLGGGQAQAPSWRGRSPRRAVRVRPLLAARSLTWRNRRSLAAPRPSFNLWNWKRDATTTRRDDDDCARA